MPIEIPAGGVEKLSGLVRNVAESAVVRQDLPADLDPVAPARDAQASKTSDAFIEKRVETLNSHMQAIRRDLHFSVDDESGKTVIRVIDRETKETIRTIPPEEISVMAHNLERFSGILFRTSV